MDVFDANPLLLSILFSSVGLILVLFFILISSRIRQKQLLKAQTDLIQKQNIELSVLQNKLTISENKIKLQDVAQEKFVSIISKDLKNPLLALKSYAYTLKSKDGNIHPWELNNYAVSLEKSLNHLIGILNNVSRWTMVQNSLQPSQVDSINLNTMIAYTFRLMKPSADKKSIALLKNINCKGEVMGDAHMIEFVLRNLISNAIKFSLEDSVVMVKLRNEEKNLVVSIKDQGVGMDEETLATLFTINEAVIANDSRSSHEKGLSLVLCKEFLQKMGGSIEVKSRPNEGSLFTVSLPKNIHAYRIIGN